MSEDILKDNRKQYENGLPGTDGQAITAPTNWGKVPVSQSLIYAFDTDAGNRGLQDVGLDGLNDAEEADKFSDFGRFEDPAADNYQFFLAADGSIVNRYKNYNGTQGNSPVDVGDTNRGSTTFPDVEDINKDNTMNTIDSYFKFSVPIAPGATVGDGFVVDERPFNQQTSDGGTVRGRWLLYKVPIEAPTR